MTPISLSGPSPWLNIISDTPLRSVMFTSRGELRAGMTAYGAFNLCHYTGDSPSHVAECRRMLAEAVGLDPSRIVVPRQTHSTEVATLTSLPVDEAALEGVDAVVTTLSGLAVGVSTADCVPVIAVDAEAGVAGAFHAGWRGAVGGIVGKGIAAMLAAGASPGRIEAFIGPSICGECFEVGEEVACRFPDEFVSRLSLDSKPHVDLPAYVVSSLVGAGVSASRIVPFRPELCTRCHPAKYFSARVSGIESGRNFTFVILK